MPFQYSSYHTGMAFQYGLSWVVVMHEFSFVNGNGSFQQNAYEGDFWSLCTVTFGPSAHGDTPPLLRHADILNGWSLISYPVLFLKIVEYWHLLWSLVKPVTWSTITKSRKKPQCHLGLLQFLHQRKKRRLQHKGAFWKPRPKPCRPMTRRSVCAPPLPRSRQ